MRGSAESTLGCEAARPSKQNGAWKLAALILSAALTCLNGCAALSNPVANGIPVRRVSPQLLGESRANMQAIPLALLRQPRPPEHKVGAGDVLGVFIEGILGEKGQAPPVRVSEFSKQPPAIGFPIPVRGNGTISLPLVPPIKVDGLTLEQVEAEIRKAYIPRILKTGRETIMVTVQRPREYHILVIRQDSAGGAEAAGGGGGGGGVTGARTTGFLLSFGAGSTAVAGGMGYALDLPVYENDVLNALARTGGFPGTDAVNEIIVERSTFKGEKGREDMMNTLQACPPGSDPMSLAAPGTRRIRIPLRYRPGQQPTVRPEDVVLQDGDIVFIQAREADVFYTAGLLPSGEYVLPRDTDLDVVDAILRVGGPIDSGTINTANISGTLLNPGIGFPSASLVSIVRETPDCGQVTIRVDLDRALRDRRERILIQPKDVIILQERPTEALARYFSQMFNVSIVYKFLNSSRAQGTTSLSVP